MRNISRNNILKSLFFILIFTILVVSLVIKSVNASGDVGGCCDTGQTSTGDECGCGDKGGGDDPPPCYPSCGGSCTFPACPSGYVTTNPNNYCTNDTRIVSCTHGNGCGGTCTKNRTCYKAETNVTLSAPSSLTMSVDGIVYTLSTNPSSPTKIKLPSINTSDSEILLKMLPTVSPNIALNRGVGYILRANNYGVNNEWSAWNDCSNSRAEDFCKESGTSANNISSGGSISYSGDYTIHTFTSSGTFTINQNITAEVLVVGGGGGGGFDAGGGGGGGGVLYNNALNVSQGSYTVTIGAGGSGSTYVGGRGSNGSNSSFNNLIIASGGGGGGSKNNSGLQGGSGGGGGHLNNSGAIGISGQGNSGATASSTRGGGGGGATSSGVSGSTSGNGGTGYLSSISGISQYYGGGGGGGNYAGAGGVGGDGGGGNGGNNSGYSGSDGVANTGGGGGANGNINASGGTGNKGGSGIVIIKYRTPESATTPNVFTFTPTSLSAIDVLKEGSTGNIGSLYYSINRCDDNRLYSSVLQTYYKVNNTPKLSASICPMNPDEQCTIDAIIDDIGGEDSQIKGCTNTEYTGSQTNNPLKISIEASDIDGNNEIKGTIVWLSKGSSSNGLVNISPTYTYSDINEIGIMLLEKNNNLQVYAINHDKTWAIAPNNTLKRSDGKDLAIIENINVLTEGSSKKYSLNITFKENTSSNPSGQYSFLVQTLDEYMYTDNWVDQSTLKRYFNWDIDLDDPVIDSFEHTIKTMQIMNLSWTLSDQISPISNYVINAYRSESSAINTEISITGKTNKITPAISTPLEEEIGNIGEPNQWEYLNINTTPHTSNADIDIGINEGGSINFYMTAFDKACNYTNKYSSVNLEPWLATKGGILYSKGNILTNTKDLTSVSDSYYIIGGSSTMRNADKNELDIGTETISSRDAFIKSLLHTEINNVRATNVSDTNDRNNYFFDYFKKNLEVQMNTLTPITDINGCTDGKNNCVFYTTEDIVIPSGYVCNKSILLMTEGNITVNPNVTVQKNGLNGCIFIAKNNIEIKEGEYISNNVVGYDYIEGFYFAQNQILIPLVDTTKVLRDGVELSGSLISMGDNIQNESALKLSRDLRLYNDINPALIIVYDNIYTKIAEIFFGQEAATYKKEVGYKL